jgi:hypothetical protein
VNFERFTSAFPNWKANFDLSRGVQSLVEVLQASPIPEGTAGFLRYQRLPFLRCLVEQGVVGSDLRFVD